MSVKHSLCNEEWLRLVRSGQGMLAEVPKEACSDQAQTRTYGFQFATGKLTVPTTHRCQLS